MKTRDEAFPALLVEHGLLGRGVEVGVGRGDFARAVLSRWPGAEYHMVDRWSHDPSYRDPTFQNVDHRENYRAALKVASDDAQTIPRVFVHPCDSFEAAVRFPLDFFDWVYIDADHSEPAVFRDIALWMPRVREGGILAGHDYVDGAPLGRPDIQVRQVVSSVFEHVNILCPEDFPTWWVKRNA